MRSASISTCLLASNSINMSALVNCLKSNSDMGSGQGNLKPFPIIQSKNLSSGYWHLLLSFTPVSSTCPIVAN